MCYRSTRSPFLSLTGRSVRPHFPRSSFVMSFSHFSGTRAILSIIFFLSVLMFLFTSAFQLFILYLCFLLTCPCWKLDNCHFFNFPFLHLPVCLYRNPVLLTSPFSTNNFFGSIVNCLLYILPITVNIRFLIVIMLLVKDFASIGQGQPESLCNLHLLGIS